ncbi:MAG: hypothetical protein K0S65_6210 [Labilithrix sp.]|nr:hypothetical protein [Labilithrix sp.]
MFRLGSSGPIALGVLVTLCTAAATLRAAESEKEPIHLDYVAEGRCPERSRILSEVEAHADSWQLAQPGARARRFVLRIEHRNTEYVGRLDIHSPAGQVSTGSEIRGPDCDDVALGLTVAVALALDPRANASPVPPSAKEPPTPPVAKGDDVPRPSPLRERERQEAPKPEASTGMSGPLVGLGVRFEGSRGVAGTMGGGALFGELAWTGTLRWFAPKVRLGARRTLPVGIDVGGGRVDMTLTAAFVELCPVALALGSDVDVGACLQGSVGSLSAAATDIPEARDEARLWLDYGGLGTVRWWLGPHVALEGCFGLSVPITRHRIRVESDAVVTRADAVVLLGSAGAVYRF